MATRLACLRSLSLLICTAQNDSFRKTDSYIRSQSLFCKLDTSRKEVNQAQQQSTPLQALAQLARPCRCCRCILLQNPLDCRREVCASGCRLHTRIGLVPWPVLACRVRWVEVVGKHL